MNDKENKPALTSPPAEALAGEAKGHDPKLAASLRDVAASLSSRPPELRGPFNVKSTSAPKEGEPTAEQVERAKVVEKNTLYRCETCPEEYNCHPANEMCINDDSLICDECRDASGLGVLPGVTAPLKAAGVSADTGVSEDEARQLLVAGWNACRKSIYAVCEDVDREAEETYLAASKSGSPTSTEGHLSEFQSGHVSGYRSGMVRASKSIARGFNSMEALDDDNLKKALEAALTVKGGET